MKALLEKQITKQIEKAKPTINKKEIPKLLNKKHQLSSSASNTPNLQINRTRHPLCFSVELLVKT